MRISPFRLLPLLCLALAACGGGRIQPTMLAVPASVECAPFARALTGVSLSGAAADWWRQAEGRYARTQRPEVGSVLVFRRSGRLPNGHVAVVSQVLSQRRIMVTQANWVHHRITVDQPVVDMSRDGDWSTVRVWWPPNRTDGYRRLRDVWLHPAGTTSQPRPADRSHPGGDPAGRKRPVTQPNAQRQRP